MSTHTQTPSIPRHLLGKVSISEVFHNEMNGIHYEARKGASTIFVYEDVSKPPVYMLKYDSPINDANDFYVAIRFATKHRIAYAEFDPTRLNWITD